MLSHLPIFLLIPPWAQNSVEIIRCHLTFRSPNQNSRWCSLAPNSLSLSLFLALFFFQELGTYNDAQGLLLPLHSRFTPFRLQRTICGVMDQRLVGNMQINMQICKYANKTSLMCYTLVSEQEFLSKNGSLTHCLSLGPIHICFPCHIVYSTLQELLKTI